MLLNCHTYYSFSYGTLSVEELLNEVVLKGHKSFVLSDINNTSACIDTIRSANEKGIKPIIGIDFRNGIKQQYIGIAKNNLGFKELNEHLSEHLHEAKNFNSTAPEFANTYVIYPLQNYQGQPLRENEFIGITIKDFLKLPFSNARHLTDKLVVLNIVSFIHKGHFNAHRLLRAIDKNTLLSKLSKDEQASPDEVMLSRDELKKAYAEYPYMLSNTERILNDCSISFEYGKLTNKNLTHYTGSIQGDIELLRSECLKG